MDAGAAGAALPAKLGFGTERRRHMAETVGFAGRKSCGGHTPRETVSVMTELVLPAQANLLGNLLGGQLMHLMDIAGALTCRRHAGTEVATVSVEGIEFKHPVHVGEIITVTSRMIWAGRTSMKVCIEVGAEDIREQTSILTNTAYFTFVALGNDGRPTPVPPLLPQTEEEKKLFAREQLLYEEKKAKRG